MRTLRWTPSVAGSIAAAAFFLSAPVFAADTFYSGRATGVNGTLNVLSVNHKVLLADVGMSCTGLPREETVSSVSNPAPLAVGADTIRSYTLGRDGMASADSRVQNFRLAIPGLTVQAGVVEAKSKSTCDQSSGAIQASGNATVANLMINGEAVAVSGASNQTINIPDVATIIINERKRRTGTNWGEFRTTGIHVKLLNTDAPANADIYVAQTRAKVECTTD
jgi:hypothetical protein